MLVRGKEVEGKVVVEGITRKILTYNQDIMTCEFTMVKGAVLGAHSHVNLQSTYVISGKMQFNVDGEDVVLEGGDNILFGENVVHSGTALEDSKVVDVFSPMRKDFL